jgi:hypothetical protein
MAKTLKDFRDKMDMAPADLDEFAEEALDIIDCPALVKAADKYITYKNKFELLLAENSINIG